MIIEVLLQYYQLESDPHENCDMILVGGIRYDGMRVK